MTEAQAGLQAPVDQGFVAVKRTGAAAAASGGEGTRSAAESAKADRPLDQEIDLGGG
jgi:hypothetical protein